jgi:hypothetical protein
LAPVRLLGPGSSGDLRPAGGGPGGPTWSQGHLVRWRASPTGASASSFASSPYKWLAPGDPDRDYRGSASSEENRQATIEPNPREAPEKVEKRDGKTHEKCGQAQAARAIQTVYQLGAHAG